MEEQTNQTTAENKDVKNTAAGEKNGSKSKIILIIAAVVLVLAGLIYLFIRLGPETTGQIRDVTLVITALDWMKENYGSALGYITRELDVSALQDVLEMPLFQPQKGYRMKLIEMCVENAKKQLELKFNVMETQQGKTDEAEGI